jgi:hypothetical protein
LGVDESQNGTCRPLAKLQMNKKRVNGIPNRLIKSGNSDRNLIIVSFFGWKTG